MKKIGAFVGKFLPPHIGHLSVIDKILQECDECVIVISDNPNRSKEICKKANFPYFGSKKRLGWFKNHYKNNKNVHFAIVDESKLDPTENYMQAYSKLFYQSVPYPVTHKYADESYRELNEKYFPTCTFVAVDRDEINIHSTAIRQDYQKNKQFVMVEAVEDIESKLKK